MIFHEVSSFLGSTLGLIIGCTFSFKYNKSVYNLYIIACFSDSQNISQRGYKYEIPDIELYWIFEDNKLILHKEHNKYKRIRTNLSFAISKHEIK